MVVAVTYDTGDVNSLALCAWKEARGEGVEGMRAVMHAIVNRVTAWGETIHNVIYGKNQFTSMSVPTDPEFNLEPSDADMQYTECLEIAPLVLNGSDPDCTNGACYYANLKNVTSGWFERNIVNNPIKHPQTVVILHQTFFK
jgi:N-acetylmuramoyl-L-alanine amidase